MCRYAMAGPYKEKLACFKCRKSFRRSYERQFTTSKAAYVADKENVICPQCSSPLNSMGLDFKAPTQSNLKQWKKVEILFNNGIIYSSCGCCGPGYRPARLNEVSKFLEEVRKQEKAKQRLKSRMSA